MNVDIDISKVKLKTERVILRPWNKNDLNDFFEYASVEDVGIRAGWERHKSIEESEKILNSFIEHKKTFAIELDGKAIGSIGIEKYSEEDLPELDELRGRELGFVLSKSYWGKGIMPEVVKEVMRYLFEDKKLDVIVCGHFDENKQSSRVQEKCGFKFYKKGFYKKQNGNKIGNNINIIYKSDWECGTAY